jgi:hypothetical protein
MRSVVLRMTGNQAARENVEMATKAKTENIVVTMDFERDTKNTYVFKCPDAAISSLYIDKDGYTGEPPKKIKVTVEPV